jgi:hypothetical protein
LVNESGRQGNSARGLEKAEGPCWSFRKKRSAALGSIQSEKATWRRRGCQIVQFKDQVPTDYFDEIEKEVGRAFGLLGGQADKTPET